MKAYMVLVKDENNVVSAMFFDDSHDARYYAQNAECGMGYYTELYVRDGEAGYVLV